MSSSFRQLLPLGSGILPDDEFFRYSIPDDLIGPDMTSRPLTQSSTHPSSAPSNDPRVSGSEQDAITCVLSGSTPTSIPASFGERHRLVPNSEMPDLSLNPESASGWEWEQQEGKIQWYAAYPPDLKSASETRILVRQKNGRTQCIPVFTAYNAADSICLDPEERLAIIAKLTKTINTLNPSACLDYRFSQNTAGIASVESAWLHQGLNTLTRSMGLVGASFREAPAVFKDQSGHWYSSCYDLEAKSRHHTHTFSKSRNIKALHEYVMCANKSTETIPGYATS